MTNEEDTLGKEITMTVKNANIIIKELDLETLEEVTGGHPFEEKFGDNDLHRAGVTFVDVFFGDDEYYIGSVRISKDLARELRSRSAAVWRNYSASGSYVDYAREWKLILLNEYGISWNGAIGTNESRWY